jgi:hypothetical protein
MELWLGDATKSLLLFREEFSDLVWVDRSETLVSFYVTTET